MRRAWILAGLLLSASVAPACAKAQDESGNVKSLEIVVPAAAGGDVRATGIDVIRRAN